MARLTYLSPEIKKMKKGDLMVLIELTESELEELISTLEMAIDLENETSKQGLLNEDEKSNPVRERILDKLQKKEG
jgi:tRNA 2-selenouridine synthase SelU